MLVIPSSKYFGAGLQIAQGQKLTWDGSTASKYFSSDGTTLALTGLNLLAPNVNVPQAGKLAFDGSTASKYFSSDGTTLTLTGLSMTMTAGIVMPSLVGISWPASGAGITQGSGQYTGTCVTVPDGNSWPAPVTMFHTGTVGANANGAETTLVQATHVNQFANAASLAGRGWHVRAWGTFAANGNTKTIKLKYGAGATEVTGGAFSTATSGGSWYLDVIIVRTTAAAAQSVCAQWNYSGTTPGSSVAVSAGAENMATLDWNFTLTGTGTATNDIAGALMRVD